MKASKDFKDSATAVAKAIDVLSEYYGSSFVQVSAKQPEFGGAKGTATRAKCLESEGKVHPKSDCP